MSTSRVSNTPAIPAKRLWFGFSASAFAWGLAGFLDSTLAWYACFGGELGWGVFTSAGLRILLGFISFGLLAITLWAGITSYLNWRRLSESDDLMEAEAYGRQQFMALCGVFLSVTLGIGIIWFSMAVYIIGICQRVR
ncbi:MAG: hypothetical protein WA252_07885 [Candidatus Sulfotelmatobacter sp.]|jgi:hypothetical protein